MFKRKMLSQAVLFSLSGALVVSVASAQTEPQKVEKIEITGSRIRTVDAESVSPTVVIDAATIRTEGARSAENLLNNLPQVFAAQGSNVSNGASGTAEVSLRGLGADRTLTLVNGRRLPYGSISTASPDLNQVPASLIKRVEVLTGGASAVYGSDAVSGVVNFIMNDKFDGIQLELNQAGFNHSQNGSGGVSDIVATRSLTNPANFAVPGNKSFDGRTFDASITMGSNFANNRGNGTMYIAYKKDDALLQSERDFSACSVASGATVFTCGGSGTAPTGRITNTNNNLVYTVADANGTARRFANATDQYNFGPANYFQRPSERYSAAMFANYDIVPAAKAYGEFFFTDYRSVAQVAPGGIFGNLADISFDNPLLSQSWKTALGLTAGGDPTTVVVQRRNVEGGGRQSEFRNTSFRTVLGVKGEVGGWGYDAFMQFSKVIGQESTKNYFSNTKIDRALDVVNDNGVAKCRSAVNGTDPNCIPYNVWTLGGVTKAQLDYISIDALQSGSTQQNVQNVTFTNDLSQYGVKLPTAKNGVNIAIGAERRVEKISRQTDAAYSSGDLAGAGGPVIGIQGDYSVRDIFAEFRAPLVEGRPFAESLVLSGSYRNSDYSTGKQTNTYGLGLEFSPIKQAKLRATYQVAVRAPNLIELFRAQGLNLYDNDADPCAGDKPIATLAECQRTGVTAAQYGKIQDSPAGQYNTLEGGNPNLNAEKSKSYTFGLALTPTRNFTATIDYFDIRVKDTIGTVTPTTTLNNCLATGDPRFCSLIQRDRLGTLWLLDEGRILSTNTNIGSTATSGIDVGFNYQFKLPGSYGQLGFDGVGTYLTKLTTEEIAGEGSYDCVGLYGNQCTTPSPKWRHKIRALWNTPWALDASLAWRYFDSVNVDTTSSNPLLAGTVSGTDKTLASRSYLDLSLAYNFNKNLTFTLGINNLLDKDPPITGTSGPGIFGNGNTFPQVYDALGRRVFLNIVAKI
jgi:iron complex outermembrane recepter protein